ncbi:MAG: hypothetical protein ABW221_06760 [Vicinamibacteria bacterium]
MSNEPVPSVPALSRLTDDALTIAVHRFATEERTSTAQLVAHLAEFDARRLHLAAGFPSLFAYCCEVLRLSEHATYNRIEAARAARRFPGVIERLADGSLNLALVRILAPHLTAENNQRVLQEASGRTKREVEELVARLRPRPDVPARIRRMPEDRAATGLQGQPSLSTNADDVGESPSTAVPATVTLVALKRHQPVVVLAPGRYEVRFTVSGSTREKLRAAQDLLRHTIPDGDTAEVFDRALTVLIEALLKRKSGAAQPSKQDRPTAAEARHVPAAVRRTVWLRDGGRCAFIGAGGRRCNTRAFLEFHHVKPYALGGTAAAGNIALRCRAHNLYEGELAFGTRASPEQVQHGA